MRGWCPPLDLLTHVSSSGCFTAVIRSAVGPPADDLHAAAVESPAVGRVGDHRVGRQRVQGVDWRGDELGVSLDVGYVVFSATDLHGCERQDSAAERFGDARLAGCQHLHVLAGQWRASLRFQRVGELGDHCASLGQGLAGAVASLTAFGDQGRQGSAELVLVYHIILFLGDLDLDCGGWCIRCVSSVSISLSTMSAKGTR